ncbi:nitroreductase family protein [Dactylosporangium sp. NPDC000555]|uniref:Acg family FMN-binding oxidoreductase n=1 Tax=Dactylosporangium sp. NPDC000555 TaxID=3154260 RepID=UPI00333492E2
MSQESQTTMPRTWGRETFIAAVGDAVWAPSIHNTQPWRFRYTDEGIDVLLDRARQVSVCDPQGRASRVSCGAATFNLRLALANAGEPAQQRLGRGDTLVHLSPAGGRPPLPVERRLYRQIRRRHTNRGPFAEGPVDRGLEAQLVEAARQESGWLDFVVGELALEAVASLIRSADAELSADPAYVAELRAWTTEADHRVEGVDRDAAGAAPHPAELLARRDFGGAEHDTTRDPVVAVFGVLGDGPADAVQAGMALQRVLLTAADLGLSTAMYSQPIEVPAIRERLRRTLGRLHDPQLVLRFGYAPTTCYTNRRPIEDVIEP